MTNRSCNALSLAPAVEDWMAKSRQPRMLHVFDRACNLINERGEVLSVVTPRIGNGPFNLVVAGEVWFSGNLNIGSAISVSDERLGLDGLVIHINSAQVWNPRPDWSKLYTSRKQIREQMTSLPVTHQMLLPDPLPSALSTALAIADISSAQTVASQLAGLGNGLTPAGDDFLMGGLYATWIIHPSEVAGKLAQEVARFAAPRTTSLSGAWLHAAGRGEAGQLWHEFFEGLLAGHKSKIDQAMEQILAVGESSGADALAGFISTLTA